MIFLFLICELKIKGINFVFVSIYSHFYSYSLKLSNIILIVFKVPTLAVNKSFYLRVPRVI
jgi:hypothetical protein